MGAGGREIQVGLPLVGGPPDIAQRAARQGIRVYAGLPDIPFDVLVVACWDRLIARAYWQRARLVVNVHPSLLPDNRGPAPLFWTFRIGQTMTGVTVHALDDRADAGVVLAQRALAVPPGVHGAAFEQDLARIGGELAVEVLRSLPAGIPQDETAATYHPWPSTTDWLIPTDRSADWAFDFVRGVGHMGGPLEVGGRAVLGLPEDGGGGELLEVQMNPGVLRVRVSASPRR